MEPRVKVLIEVEHERDRQIAKGYAPRHDDEHTPGEFAGFIVQRTHDVEDDHEPRTAFIQIAALAVAAVESMDRRS